MHEHMDTAFRTRRTERRGDALPFRGSSDLRAPAPMTDDERQIERTRNRSSVVGGDRKREAVLAIRCPDHHATPGEHCWRDPRSRVLGFCWPRWERSVTQAVAVLSISGGSNR